MVFTRTYSWATILLLSSFVAADIPPVHDYAGYNSLKYGIVPNQSYLTTDFVSPLFQVNIWDKEKVDTSLPYLFIAVNQSEQLWSPMIFDSSDLSLVYADPKWEGAMDTRIQTYKNTSYLTYWAGTFTDAGGHGEGHCLFLDDKYQLAYNISTVNLPSGVMTDMHECQITDDGTVIITTYIPTKYDLTAVGGPADGMLLDSAFEEIDMETMESRFVWRASEHFNISDTYVPYTESESAWDFFHINSIQKIGKNYLVNGRHLKVVTMVNGTTGSPIWHLGGRHNQFTDLSGGNATNFGFQHHVRYWDGDLSQLTMFDNHELILGHGCTTNCSQGLHLQLDYDAMTVSVVAQYFHPESMSSIAMGSYQKLPSDNVLLNWGMNPSFTQHLPSGECVQDVQFSIWNGLVADYRIFADTWVGHPPWDPAIASKDGKVYVSWNGATEVRSWVLYTGSTAKCLKRSNSVPKSRFETSIEVDSGSYARVVALDANKNVLGSTEIIEIDSGCPS